MESELDSSRVRMTSIDGWAICLAYPAFAASVGAVSQREAPVAAVQRARDLDRFCADADIEVAVNVVGQYGATLAVPRVKALALEHGLSETASGELVSFDASCSQRRQRVACRLRRLGYY